MVKQKALHRKNTDWKEKQMFRSVVQMFVLS